VLTPLLALGADQVTKIRRANQAYGSVHGYHLDEINGVVGIVGDTLLVTEIVNNGGHWRSFLFCFIMSRNKKQL
jgi:hypothetical protein